MLESQSNFLFLIIAKSFLVRDYRDSLQMYFKPRHNGP